LIFGEVKVQHYANVTSVMSHLDRTVSQLQWIKNQM